MEKENDLKKNNAFIIRDHYQSDGVRVKDLMEKDVYKKIINNLGWIDPNRTICYTLLDKRSECGAV